MPPAGKPEAREEQQVELEGERARNHDAWTRSRQEQMPLPIAAARAMHQVLGKVSGLVPQADYEISLNIAAAALARRIPVYCFDPRDGWVIATVPEAAVGRFNGGGASLVRARGETLSPLSLRRADAEVAVPLVCKAGLADYLPASLLRLFRS